MSDILNGSFVRRPLALTAAVVAVALVLVAVVRAQEAPDAPARPAAVRSPVVAVVDMQTVLRQSEQWRDMAQERTRLLETMRSTIQNLTSTVQVLSNEYSSLPPGTEERRAKQQELQEAGAELQQKRQEFERQVAERYSEDTRRMFTAVGDAVAAYAAEHEIDLVLKKQQPADQETPSIGQDIMVVTTEVLYASDAMDISEAIVRALNADYPGPIEVQ